MRCPKCKGKEKTKNGFKSGLQRYRCKTCGCNYTKSTPHGSPIEVKREPLRYYFRRYRLQKNRKVDGRQPYSGNILGKKAGKRIKGIALISISLPPGCLTNYFWQY